MHEVLGPGHEVAEGGGGGTSSSSAMRRSQSTPHNMDSTAAAALHRALERQLRLLQHELGAVQQRVAAFEDINARWGLRYTRRLAMGSSAFLGFWIFLARLLNFLRARRSQLLQAVMPKLQLRQRSPAPHLSPLALRAGRHALRRSWLFFLCAVLLARKPSWNRLGGATLSLTYTAYLSFVGDARQWPWPLLFNVFGNVSYLVASMNAEPSQLPNYLDYSLIAQREHDHDSN